MLLCYCCIQSAILILSVASLLFCLFSFSSLSFQVWVCHKSLSSNLVIESELIFPIYSFWNHLTTLYQTMTVVFMISGALPFESCKVEKISKSQWLNNQNMLHRNATDSYFSFLHNFLITCRINAIFGMGSANGLYF